MDFHELLASRRSVKSYDPKYKLSSDELKKLKSAVLLSPTSFNIQNWRIAVLTDNHDLRAKVCEAAWNQAQIKEASAVFIFCGDVKAWERETERYWKLAPAEIQTLMSNMTRDFYKGRESLQRDEVLRSCGIAAQSLMLQAKSMGLESCPMIGFDQSKVAELVNLPKDFEIGLIVVVGKALSPARDRSGPIGEKEVFFTDRF